MTEYQLIAIDMDGTLLTSDKRILPETVRDMEVAANSGKTVVLCTGRSVVELSEYRKELQSIRYGVLGSGACVYDFAKGAPIYEKALDRSEVLAAAEVAERYDAMLHLMESGRMVVRKDLLHHMEDFGMGVYQPMFEKLADPVEDIREEIDRLNTVLKVLIYFRMPEDRAEGYDALKGMPFEFAFAEKTSLELSPAGVNKGDGLRRLAEHLGFSLEQVIAVGDADNDRTMLTAAGLAAAMGNAAEEIKGLADVVTLDNDHNGVGEVIRKYLL